MELAGLSELGPGRVRARHEFDGYQTVASPELPRLGVMAIRLTMLELSARIADGVSLSTGASIDYLAATVGVVAETAVDVRSLAAREINRPHLRGGAHGVHSSIERIWSRAPVRFDETLVDDPTAVVRTATGRARRLVNGPLHDACKVSASGIPTAMPFVSIIGGIRHGASESTHEEHLQIGVRALAVLTVCLLAKVDAQ